MQFEVGKSYSTRSICDHECVVRVSVVSRTAKTIRTAEGKSFRVFDYQGVEQVRPWGRYSMAPIVGADDAE